MGTIIFTVMVFVLGRKQALNDYQILCLLISLDTIALALWLNLKASCCKKTQ